MYRFDTIQLVTNCHRLKPYCKRWQKGIEYICQGSHALYHASGGYHVADVATLILKMVIIIRVNFFYIWCAS